jgi:hypothetical protein
MAIDPWELLREARNELSVLASYVENRNTVWPTAGLKVTAVAQKKLRDRIDAALTQHSNTSKPLPRDVLCPKCGTPKTNPYKCERCSEYWGP